MPVILSHNSYGKSAVRLTRIHRATDRHELTELDVAIELQGDFADSYLTGDNAKIVATDTMKNTVYALASLAPIVSPEEFGIRLAAHFMDQFAHIQSTSITLSQTTWNRLSVNDQPHPHAFIDGGSMKRTASILHTRSGVHVSAGVKDLNVLKTTASEFTGYLKDQYTTLPPTTDRIFATRVACQWLYELTPGDFNNTYDTIIKSMLDCFALHHSLAVQQTMHAMGIKAMEICPQIKSIEMEMPNQHRIPFNLAPLGLDNKNEIFVTTCEPFGLIRETLSRD